MKGQWIQPVRSLLPSLESEGVRNLLGEQLEPRDALHAILCREIRALLILKGSAFKGKLPVLGLHEVHRADSVQSPRIFTNSVAPR